MSLQNTLWLHGSPKKIKKLEQDNPYNTTDYTNSGFGLFLTKNIKVANSYAQNGYITTLEVDTSQCYVCNYDEFWCMSEPFFEEDIDPMGNYMNLPGSYSRKKFLKLGYTTLIYQDEEMGEVLVALDMKVVKIIKSSKV